MKPITKIFLFSILLIFLTNGFAQVLPKELEKYYNDPNARYGPSVGTCRTDADCEKYNYDRNSCYATWAGWLDPTMHIDERMKDWRNIHIRNESDPLWPYIGQSWYSQYMSNEQWRYQCIKGQCYLDPRRSKTERIFCEYGCDIYLGHCLCMPQRLEEFRCSDDFSSVLIAELHWSCEKVWVEIANCSQRGAKCAEDPRYPGYLTCVLPNGKVASVGPKGSGTQYATLYPIHGGKPITVAVNTETTTASKNVDTKYTSYYSTPYKQYYTTYSSYPYYSSYSNYAYSSYSAPYYTAASTYKPYSGTSYSYKAYNSITSYTNYYANYGSTYSYYSRRS